MEFQLLSVKIRHESSAYRSRSQFTDWDMSFTYKRNISGPSIEPCGTPHKRLPGLENSFSIFTKNVLLCKYDFNQAILSLLKPRHYNLSKNIS